MLLKGEGRDKQGNRKMESEAVESVYLPADIYR
jgi:hypothetical protein